ATSTAGSPSSSNSVTKPAETRSVMHPSGTSTTSEDTPMADSPHSQMDAARANAGTRFAKCPDGTSPSSTADSTAGRTRATSPPPPGTTPAAAPPIHHDEQDD